MLSLGRNHKDKQIPIVEKIYKRNVEMAETWDKKEYKFLRVKMYIYIYVLESRYHMGC